jgi:hypothetical protein
MVIDPPTGDNGGAIESGNTCLGEEGSEDVADHTTDTVSGEDIEGIIISGYDFELGGEIADCASYDTENNRGGRADETGCRSDGDKARNGTRAEANSGPFPLKTVILKREILD